MSLTFLPTLARIWFWAWWTGFDSGGSKMSTLWSSTLMMGRSECEDRCVAKTEDDVLSSTVSRSLLLEARD